MENISQAILYTLLHSLWQGALLALLAAGIMVFTRARSAALRHRLLTGALFLFVLVVLCIFGRELNTHGSPDEWAGPLQNKILIYLQQHATLFVAAWLALVIVKTGHLLLGIYSVHRLRTTEVRPLPEVWQQRCTTLAANMKITRAVTLLESGVAKVPLLIGHLKPVILIPLGLISSLSPEQVEAILLHELAHVVRKDYLINLGIRIIESLLFFNPAVLWLSYLIRSEREHCCDDLVIRQTNNLAAYLRALISFEELRLTVHSGQALAFSGDAGAIPQRIERMIRGRNRSIRKLEAILLSVMTVIVITISMSNVKLRTTAVDQTCTTCPYMHDGETCPFCKDMEMSPLKSKKQL